MVMLTMQGTSQEGGVTEESLQLPIFKFSCLILQFLCTSLMPEGFQALASVHIEFSSFS